jgi:hypothetical protein
VQEAKERKEKTRLERKALVKDLRALGIATAQAEYDGSGDSGDIQSVEFLDAANQGVKLSDEVEKRFSDVVMDALCTTHGGWEINDGAYGTFTLDVGTGKAKLDHNERYTETNNSEDELDFGEGGGDSSEDESTVEPAERSPDAEKDAAPARLAETADEISALLYDHRFGLVPLSTKRVVELKGRFREITGRKYEG